MIVSTTAPNTYFYPNNMIQENVSLKRYNTFAIDVKAANFAAFRSVDELQTLLRSELAKNSPILLLGGGSNILLTADYDGLVLRNELNGIEIIREEDDSVFVKTAAGEVWHDLVLYCISEGLGGIENLSLIPGSVGAAPMQNIGAYGVEIKDVFEELQALNRETLEVETFKSEDCQFDYRESVFKRDFKDSYVITSVTLRLSRNHQLNTSYGAVEDELTASGISNPTIRDVSEAVIKIRQSKLPDPEEIGNSGSFFKNPVISASKFRDLKERFPEVANYPLPNGDVKIAAAWLIDQAGWKGKTFDNYGVHKNQALVLVNYGNAEGSAIYQLSEDILESILEIYGIHLEREVNVI